MMSGKCVACGAAWSSKCVKCRNVFWEELTPKQMKCLHTENITAHKCVPCPYTGCTYEDMPKQFASNGPVRE